MKKVNFQEKPLSAYFKFFRKKLNFFGLCLNISVTITHFMLKLFVDMALITNSNFTPI